MSCWPCWGCCSSTATACVSKRQLDAVPHHLRRIGAEARAKEAQDAADADVPSIVHGAAPERTRPALRARILGGACKQCGKGCVEAGRVGPGGRPRAPLPCWQELALQGLSWCIGEYTSNRPLPGDLLPHSSQIAEKHWLALAAVSAFGAKRMNAPSTRGCTVFLSWQRRVCGMSSTQASAAGERFAVVHDLCVAERVAGLQLHALHAVR